jgi:hypothetical protein
MDIQPIQQKSAIDLQFKFICVKCDYKTNRYYNYQEHKRSIKHIKRKSSNIKSATINKTNNDGDILINLNTELLEKNNTTNIKQTQYLCDKCNYSTSKKSNFNQHLSSKKHKSMNKPKEYNCECGKMYPYRSSLFNHKKNCNYKKEEVKEGGHDPQAPGCAQEINYKELIITLLNQNKELQDLLIKQQEETNKKYENLILHINSNT